MLRENGDVALIDFGLARALDAAPQHPYRRVARIAVLHEPGAGTGRVARWPGRIVLQPRIMYYEMLTVEAVLRAHQRWMSCSST